MRQYLSVIAACVGLLLSCGAAPAWDASRKQQYPSPDLNAPNVDRLNIRGPGSTGDISGMGVNGIPLSAVIAQQGGRAILTPGALDVRGVNTFGFLLDRWSSPRSGNYESFTVQNSDVTGQDIISPQIPPGHFKGENIRSVMVVPDGTTTGTNSAFGYYVRNDSATDAVGVFGTTVCNKNGASCWAENPTVIDHTANGVDTSAFNFGRQLIGSELDVQVTSRDTTVSGYNCTGSSGIQPKAASCFQVGHLLAADPSRGIKWTYGLTVDNATSKTALLIGADAISGKSIGSMPSFYNYFDNNSIIRAATLAATGSGAFSFGNTASQNTVEIQPAPAGQFPSIRPGGVDGNADTGLVLQGRGAGQVITQSLLNANQGLYVGGPTTFTQPIQLPVYTVASLPACNASRLGQVAAVYDATNPTYAGAVTGGGTTPSPVFCRGDVWIFR